MVSINPDRSSDDGVDERRATAPVVVAVVALQFAGTGGSNWQPNRRQSNLIRPPRRFQAASKTRARHYCDPLRVAVSTTPARAQLQGDACHASYSLAKPSSSPSSSPRHYCWDSAALS